MAGILRTPTDMSAPPAIGPSLSPPIIPGLTQIAPGAMRALLRGGVDEETPDNEQVSPPDDEQGLLAEFGNLFWKAAEYPGLQDVMLSFGRALKRAADQKALTSMMQSSLQMPSPMVPDGSTPQGDLLTSLLGGIQ